MTTKEAQSEAPSVEKILRSSVSAMGELIVDGQYQSDNPDGIWDSTVAKINRLITEARIDELKQLLGRQWWADDQHHEDEVVPYHHIEAQIKLLSNNLSKELQD